MMLFNLLAVAAAIASLATGWPTAHPAWLVAVVVWLAYFQHTWTTIFHEDAHYALYRAKWHNIFNGTIIGTLLIVPFTAYRQVHIRHHAKMNMPEDWELWPYCDPTTSLRFRRVFLWLDILLGWWVGPYIYGRIAFVKHSPLRPETRRRIYYEYGLIVLFWGGILALVAATGSWLLLVKVYVIPAWVTGMFQTLRKLTEHLGLPAGDAMAGARTVMSRKPIGRALAATSFHIDAHGLHHWYPQMPHNKLERVYDTMQPGPAAPVFPSYPRAMRDMMRHLARPGIGVNVAPLS